MRRCRFRDLPEDGVDAPSNSSELASSAVGLGGASAWPTTSVLPCDPAARDLPNPGWERRHGEHR